MAYLWTYAATYPNKRIRVIAETIPAVKSGALKNFIQIGEATKRYRSERLKGSSTEDSGVTYYFANGSKIAFKAFDTVGKAKAHDKWDVTFFNEANHIRFDIADACIIRTNEFCIYDFNPDKRFWVHDEILTKPDSEFLLLKYTDNEACPDNIIQDLNERLEKAKTSPYWDNWCRVYVHGEIGKLEGVIFDNWDIIESIHEDARLMCYGLDFGFNPDPNALVALYKFNDEMIVHEVFQVQNQTSPQLIDALKRLVVHGYPIVYDSSQPAMGKLMRDEGLEAVKCAKKSIMGSIAKLQMEKIKITRSSKNLIAQLESYIWDETGQPKGEDHLIDALKYGYDRYKV